MDGSGAVLGPVVNNGPAVDQSNHHPGRLAPQTASKTERGLCNGHLLVNWLYVVKSQNLATCLIAPMWIVEWSQELTSCLNKMSAIGKVSVRLLCYSPFSWQHLQNVLPSYHKAFEIELAAFYPFLYAWFEAIEIKQGGYIFPIRNWRNLNFRFYHCIYHSVYGTGLHKNNHNNKRAKMVLRIPCMQQFAIKMASWSQNQIMQPHFTYKGVIIKLF